MTRVPDTPDAGRRSRPAAVQLDLPETVCSFGARLTALAAARGQDVALVYVPLAGMHQCLTYARLEDDANRIARVLAAHGVGQDWLVAVGLPTHPLHVKAAYAAWKLGACVLPLNFRMPATERDGLLAIAEAWRPVVSVGAWADGRPPAVHREEVEALEGIDPSPLPDRVATPPQVIASGGTTGRPKITVSDEPGVLRLRHGNPILPADPLETIGLRLGDVQMICTPLYHTSGFGWTHRGLRWGNLVVLLERFQAERCLDAVERYRVNHTMFVPEILRRLLDVPDLDKRDLSSYTALCHGGAPCPEWVKRRWLDLVGPAHVYEGLGATEPIGATVIRGDEWLAHPRTVGKPVASEVRVVDEAGCDLPAGEVGEIFMRPRGAVKPPFRYIGAEYKRTLTDGWVTLGDFGWLDAEGYLYFADRRTDMIVTGGANVYPAEVEAALSEHPKVADVGVIGIPDDLWGRRVHAVIKPLDPLRPPAAAELDAHVRSRLAPYKVPKTYEFADEVPRTEVFKLRRVDLGSGESGRTNR